MSTRVNHRSWPLVGSPFAISSVISVIKVGVAMLHRVRFDCSFLAILLALTLTTLGLGGCTSGSGWCCPL